MRIIEVRTQAELDAALTAYDQGATADLRVIGAIAVSIGDSSQVRAYDSSQVTAYGSSQVTAAQYVAVTIHADTVRCDGGHVIRLPQIRTAAEWCTFHGVPVTDDVAVLYKAVGDDYRSGRGFLYTPGTCVEAPDWDGPARECGGGLHFVAHPAEGLAFDHNATRFLACPVALADIVVHFPAQYPQKIKARRTCGPIYECDIDGNPLPAPAVAVEGEA